MSMMGNWQIHTHTHTHTHIYIHVTYIKYKYKYESYEIVILKAQAITKSKENKLVWASKHLNIILYYFHLFSHSLINLCT